MDLLQDLGPGEGQDVVGPGQGAAVGGEPLAVEVLLRQPRGLDHGAHATVQEKDPALEFLHQALDALRRGGFREGSAHVVAPEHERALVTDRRPGRGFLARLTGWAGLPREPPSASGRKMPQIARARLSLET